MNHENQSSSEQKLIASLRDAQLKYVRLDPERMAIALRFTFGTDRPDVMVHLRNTAHIAISKDPNDEELPAVVGIATLVPLSVDRISTLTKLAYPFRNTDDPSTVFTYSETPLYHFHLEGDICLDIVCGKYSVGLTVGR